MKKFRSLYSKDHPMKIYEDACDDYLQQNNICIGNKVHGYPRSHPLGPSYLYVIHSKIDPHLDHTVFYENGFISSPYDATYLIDSINKYTAANKFLGNEPLLYEKTIKKLYHEKATTILVIFGMKGIFYEKVE